MNGEQQIKKAYESILGHDFEQAIEWFEQAVASDPNNAAYHYKLSITYARSNKLAKALEHAKRASELDAEQKEYRFHLHNLQAKALIEKADVYMQKGADQYHLAVSLLKQAVALDPLAINGYLLMGIAFDGLQEYHQALQAVKEVLKLDPQHEIAAKLQAEYQAKLTSYLQS